MDQRSLTETAGAASSRYTILWDSQDVVPEPKEFLADYPNATAREVVDVLLVDQVARWQKGVGRPVEEYLRTFSTVREDPELFLDLVYGECRARANLGEVLNLDAILDRFPNLQVDLKRQLEVEQWLRGVSQDVCNSTRSILGDLPRVSGGTDVDESTDAFAALSFEDFSLQGAIGEGAMGEVYRASQKSLRRWVAIKVLKAFGQAYPNGVEWFLREARAVASLRHPNIVTIYGIGRMPDGGYFIAMELIEGVSLKEATRDGPMEPVEAARIVAQIADGIDHAHIKGVIHRDLKPSNVLMEKDGRVVVTDFGLAKQRDHAERSLSTSGNIVGTPQFMAPEQVDSRWGEVGPATDVYGLGALLYVLLVGCPPTKGDSVIEVLTAIGAGKPTVAPGKLRPGIPSEIDGICLKCLAVSPKDRYHTAQEVAEALRREVDRLRRNVTEIGSQPKAGWIFRWIKGNRRAHICAVLMMVVVGIALLYTFTRQGRTIGNGTVIGGQAATETESSNSSENWRKADVTWTIDTYRQGQMDDRVRLTDVGGAVRNGDKLRVRVDLTEPLHVYLVWIGSEGSVAPLYPNESASDRVTRSVTVPSSDRSGLPVRGPPGAEICLLIMRHSPLSDSDKRDLMDRLHPPRSIGSFSPSALFVDGRSAWSSEGRSERNGQAAIDSETALEQLSFDSGSRSVGPPEPLDGLPACEAISEWARQATSGYGEVRYLVLPHIER